jgi:hypothetical protein
MPGRHDSGSTSRPRRPEAYETMRISRPLSPGTATSALNPRPAPPPTPPRAVNFEKCEDGSTGYAPETRLRRPRRPPRDGPLSPTAPTPCCHRKNSERKKTHVARRLRKTRGAGQGKRQVTRIEASPHLPTLPRLPRSRMGQRAWSHREPHPPASPVCRPTPTPPPRPKSSLKGLPLKVTGEGQASTRASRGSR